MDFYESKDKYLTYVNNHKESVERAWNMFKTKLKGYKYLDDDFIVNTIDSNIKSHDESKFSEEEFDPYRNKWYPFDGEEINEEAFAKAWEHHKEANPHHWEYWYEPKTDSFKSPTFGNAERFVYLVEMICDWIAMGDNEDNQNAMDWYDTNKNIVKFRPNERDMVEEMLRLYYA